MTGRRFRIQQIMMTPQKINAATTIPTIAPAGREESEKNGCISRFLRDCLSNEVIRCGDGRSVRGGTDPCKIHIVRSGKEGDRRLVLNVFGAFDQEQQRWLGFIRFI
jgi:hypothetical protein